MTHHHLIMFVAGLGIPVLAAMNARLGGTLGAPATATTIFFFIAMMSAFVVALITGIGPVSKLADVPKYTFLGGVLIACYLLSITWIAPIIGLGNAVFLVLIGQLCAAAAIDQFGLFGAIQRDVTLTRAGGLALMAIGVFLAQRG